LSQHRDGVMRGFTKRYGVKRLAWLESHDTMESAILREKRIKKWERAWKIAMIETDNPDWRDLAIDFGFGMIKSTRLTLPPRHPGESGDPSPNLPSRQSV
jgi:putative endonuclease